MNWFRKLFHMHKWLVVEVKVGVFRKVNGEEIQRTYVTHKQCKHCGERSLDKDGCSVLCSIGY